MVREREGPSPQGWEGEGTAPRLCEIVDTLRTASRAEVGAHLAGWLDRLDATGRWALLKLVTGALRIGVSARLAKVALAEWAEVEIGEIEEVWHGLAPPYLPLFAWLSGEDDRPAIGELPNFTPLMLSQPLEEEALSGLDPAAYFAEWKWDGIRVQLVAVPAGRRIYSRGAEDVSHTFPEITEAMDFHAVLDGEMLVLRDGVVAPFADLQQRLNRKVVSGKLADQAGLGGGEGQLAGDGSQAKAAVRIRLGLEVAPHQRDLREAGLGKDQALQKRCKRDHAASASSSP